MRTNKLLLAVIAVMYMFSITAQDIIPIDSVHLLNTEQNKLLKYTRNLVKKRHNKIKLPIEINSMLGDSLNEKRYESILHFNKAYFIKMSNCKASLVIPMQAKVDTITINSELNIITAEDDDIYRIVYTAFTLPSDSVPQYMYLKSSVNGFLYSSVFMENDQVVAEVKGNDVGKTAIIDSHKHQHPMNNTSIYEKAGVGRFPQTYISDRLKSLSIYTALDPSYMMKKDRSF